MNLAEHRHLGITATCSTQECVEEGLGSQRGCTGVRPRQEMAATEDSFRLK